MKSLLIITLFAGLLSSSYCLADDGIRTTNYIRNQRDSYLSLKLGYANVKTDENIYFYNIENDDINHGNKNIATGGLSGNLSIGKKFGFFRPELELSFAYMNREDKIKNEIVIGTVRDNLGRETTFRGLGDIKHTSKFNNYSLMLNLLFDIPTGTAFTPYLGFGGGYGYNKLTINEKGRAKSIDDNSYGKLDAEIDIDKLV